jgi:hypothetical protein
VSLRLWEESQAVLRRGDGELSAMWLLVPVAGYFDLLSKKDSQVTKKENAPPANHSQPDHSRRSVMAAAGISTTVV